MDRYEAARTLGLADADVLEVADTERGTEVEVRAGGRRLIRDDGFYALDAAAEAHGLRRWPDTETAPEPAPESSTDVDGPPSEVGSTALPAEPPADNAAVPSGTAEEVLAWVGDDSDRAIAALEAEEKRDKPRGTLVAKLEKVVG